MQWEVDWAHPSNKGWRVMARNPASHLPSARDWHLTTTAELRRAGISTPTYRKDSWEVDWETRNGKLVWARNPESKLPSSRDWHWIDCHTVQRAGMKWRPKKEKLGRFLSPKGYVILGRTGLTTEEERLAEEAGIFRGRCKGTVTEHQLVALKKYGRLPAGAVVRHLNGISSDNHPDNLVLGTTRENTLDHECARLEAMYWRCKYEAAVAGEINAKKTIREAVEDLRERLETRVLGQSKLKFEIA